MTSLRGIAAVLVVLFHFRVEVENAIDVSRYTAFVANGYLWVDFFFVLSGFVITYVYRQDFQAGSASLVTYGRFLWRRLARIYPLHVVVLLTMVAGELAKLVVGWTRNPPFANDNSPGELLANLALVHSWGIYDHLTWNFPSWSISTEWAAYLLFPLLLPVFSRSRLRVVLAAMPLLVAGLFALVALHPRDDLDITFDFGLVRCLLSFALGIGTFRLYDVIRSRRIALNADWLLAAGLLWIVLVMHNDLHAAWTAPGFVAVVLLGALGTGWLSQVLGSGPLHHLGEISYSIYLLQYPVQRVWDIALRKMYEDDLSRMDPWLAAAVVASHVAVVIALSTFTYAVIEKPARRHMAAFSVRPAAVIPALSR